MIAISEGIKQDGFYIFLLIAGFAFLWFRRSAKRQTPAVAGSKAHSAVAIENKTKERRNAA